MRRWLPGRVLDAVSLHVSGIRRKVRESLLLKAVAHHTDQRWVLHVRRAVASGPAGAAGRNADGTGLWNTARLRFRPCWPTCICIMHSMRGCVGCSRRSRSSGTPMTQSWHCSNLAQAEQVRDAIPARLAGRAGPAHPANQFPDEPLCAPARPDRAFRIRAWMTSPVSAPVASSGCGRAPSCSRRAALLGVAWTSQIVEPTFENIGASLVPASASPHGSAPVRRCDRVGGRARRRTDEATSRPWTPRQCHPATSHRLKRRRRCSRPRQPACGTG